MTALLPLSHPRAHAIAARIAARANVTLVYPHSTEGLAARGILAAAALVGRAVGLATWDAGTLAERVSVTLSSPISRVYLSPAAVLDPVTLVSTVTHETGHAWQAEHIATPGDPSERGGSMPWPSVVAWPILYLGEPEARAKAEADQYAASEWVRRRLGAQAQSYAAALASMREGYHLDAPAVVLAEDILRSHWATMDAGGVPAVWSAVQAAEVLAEVAGEVLAGTL